MSSEKSKFYTTLKGKNSITCVYHAKMSYLNIQKLSMSSDIQILLPIRIIKPLY